MGWRKQPTPSLEESAQDEYVRRIGHAYATGAIEADVRRTHPGLSDDEAIEAAVLRMEFLTAHVVSGGHLGRRLEPLADPPSGSGLAAALRRGYRGPTNAADTLTVADCAVRASHASRRSIG